MLGSATPSSATLHTSNHNAASTTPSPASPTRPSRLRGLSYLRSYTHNHLHSSRSEAPPLTRTTSSPTSPNPNSGSSSRPTAPVRRQSSTTTNTPERGSHAVPVSPSRIESGEHGWIPTIQGRSGLSRESLHPTTTSTTSASPEPSSTAAMMTRSRAAGAIGPTPATSQPSQRRQQTHEVLPNSELAPMPTASSSTPTTSKDNLPTIRFIPHVETRSSRPSLQFTAVSRTLPGPSSVVRVGRYSERDNHTGDPNALPVGFKSKVVSRRHCEFWCTDGQWYIKDVKSSSGTFLNHVRLSSPGVESRPYPVNDGDVVQLGIDFKGGEEVIFRCVKIRVECNRGWQKSLNNFNTSAHKRLLRSALGQKTRDSDAASVSSSECSICLNPVAPCQALFVAPCSHVWHYKCVRNLIHSPQWPNFLCPNCRFMADLEADVEQPEDEEYEFEAIAEQMTPPATANPELSATSDDSSGPNESDDGDEQQRSTSLPRIGNILHNSEVDEDLAALLSHTAIGTPSPFTNDRHPSSASPEPFNGTQPITIAQSSLGSRNASDPIGARSMTPTTHTQFALAAGPIGGPVTPRNDAGPFLLDGSGGRENSLAIQPLAEVSEPASAESRHTRGRK